MKNSIKHIKIIILAITLSFGINFTYAWVAPTDSPPGGNATAPINESSTPQTKRGAIKFEISPSGGIPLPVNPEMGSFKVPGITSGVGFVSFGEGFVGWDYGAQGIALNAHGAGGSIGGIFIKRENNAGSNVGIGTVAPGAKLDVGVDSAQCCATQQPNISLAQGSNTNGRMSWLQFHNAGESEAYIRLAGGGPAGSSRSGQRRLEIGDSQSVKTSLTVQGNIGIGTTLPDAKLSVIVPANSRGIEAITSTAGNTHLPWSDNWNYISGLGTIFRNTSNVETVRINTTTGVVVAAGLQVTGGAAPGRVLTSDGAGNATWVAPAGAASTPTLDAVLGAGNFAPGRDMTVSRVYAGTVLSGDIEVTGGVKSKDWKILASASDYTETATINLSSSGISFSTDPTYNDQRVNVGLFHWPSDQAKVTEIMFKVSNDSDDYCAGGGNSGSIGTNGCQDLRYRGTTLTRRNENQNDWIMLFINGSPQFDCRDQMGRFSDNGSYPGRYGHPEFDVYCYYTMGGAGLLNLQVREVDRSGGLGLWDWEIWYR